MTPVKLDSYTDLFSEYTELRAQENRTLVVAIVNGDVMGNSRSTGSGVSARTFRKGIWGFASNPIIDDESIKMVIRAATRNSQFLAGKENRTGYILPSSPGRSTKDFSTKKHVCPRKS